MPNWDRFYDELRAFVLSRVKSESEADDIVQDAFLRAHRATLEGQSLDNPRAWLYRVVRNLMNDTYRASARRRALGSDLAQESVVDPDSLQSNLKEEGEVFALVARTLPLFIASLDAPHAEAVRLVDLEGRTHVEAAREAGVSLPCMKARVRRGRAQLLSALQDCCAFDVDARGRVIDWKRRSSGKCGCSG